MNKKKLALTLLLSSVSAVVVAGSEGTANVAPKTDSKTDVKSVETKTTETKTTDAKDTKTTGEIKTSKDVVTDLGYARSAYNAFTDNKVAVAALVAVSALAGAIIHAAVAENEPVEETEETE